MIFRIIAALFILAGITCFVLFTLADSTVTPDGHLQEPFALLPVGWAFILTGGTGLIVSCFLRRCKRQRQKHH